MKLKIGDQVKVTLGKDRGKTGKVEAVIIKTNSVVVGGVNMYTKHVKKQGDKAGEKIERPRPLVLSKVALICPHCHQPTRVGYTTEKDKKVRLCRKCKAKI
jgi:large subunit ribosomal protein L24